MGILDGALQQAFGGAFASVYLEGRHYRRTKASAANGDITGTVEKVQSIRGYAETTNDRMRADLGFTDKESRLFVLQTYEGRVIDTPKREDRIRLDGVDWTLGDVEQDGAHTHWIIRAARA